MCCTTVEVLGPRKRNAGVSRPFAVNGDSSVVDTYSPRREGDVVGNETDDSQALGPSTSRTLWFECTEAHPYKSHTKLN